jgi:hypothetical protein
MFPLRLGTAAFKQENAGGHFRPNTMCGLGGRGPLQERQSSKLLILLAAPQGFEPQYADPEY